MRSGANLKPLQRELLRRVAEQLGSLGFDQNVVGQSIYHPVSIGRWALHLAFIDHSSDFDVTADVAVRVDAVEEMINVNDKSFKGRDKYGTATIGAELGNLIDGRQRRWTVTNPEDVASTATSIVKEFTQFGLPYLERMSDLEHMRRILAANDASAWRHSPIHGVRCKVVLALTLMLYGVARAREFAPSLERFLEQRNDFALADFRDFARHVLGTVN